MHAERTKVVTDGGEVSQSVQMAVGVLILSSCLLFIIRQPFNAEYRWTNLTTNYNIDDSDVTKLNTYLGAEYQQAVSAVSWTNPESYELNGGVFSTYGFEVCSPAII